MNQSVKKYYLKILPEYISNHKCGESDQIKILLNSIIKLNRTFFWYYADVETIPDNWTKYSYNKKPIYIGNTLEFIASLNSKYQFIFAVFLCLESSKVKIDWKKDYYSDDFKEKDFEGAYLKLHVFDTSWYEIYSLDVKLIQYLSDLYNGKIEEYT